MSEKECLGDYCENSCRTDEGCVRTQPIARPALSEDGKTISWSKDNPWQPSQQQVKALKALTDASFEYAKARIRQLQTIMEK